MRPAHRLNSVLSDDDVLPRLAAAAATLALLVLVGRLLMLTPRPAQVEAQVQRIQLHLLSRPSAPPATPDAPPPVATERPAPRPLSAELPPSASSDPVPAPAMPPAGTAALYDARGQVRLPPGTVPPPAPPAERDLLHPPNPVEYRGTRFEKDWAGNEDPDAAMRRVRRAVTELLNGKDVQPARARPAPEVRYNPARHGRPSDLGSEATGDAWRAAPINDEPLPGMEGQASARIRAQVDALEREHAGCERPRVQPLLEPARHALDELQRAEHAYTHGADPIRAATLPTTASGAYNQARRALWYARSRLGECRR